MKIFFWLPVFLAGFLFSQAQVKPAVSGYDIKLTVKPYKNQWIYLAYYYGGIKGLADSAWLDANSKGSFKGQTVLPQGIYIVASPSKTILFEVLMGKNQQFSISADNASLDKSLLITGSTDNQQFMDYTSFISSRAIAIEKARKHLQEDLRATPKEKAAYQATIEKNQGEIDTYRKNLIAQQPDGMLSVLFKSMQEVTYPANLQHPKTRQDSLAQYRYGKDHFWDGVDFTDGRLVRTPIFENKLRSYLNNWVVPDADSIIYEFNWMIALGRNDPEMFKYLIGYFVDNYMYPKIMGQDKVFLEVYQRFISGDKTDVNWLNEKQMKAITDRAYMIMANQLGTQAWDIQLTNTNGKLTSLYNLNADYTVVAFWDVNSSKCRDEIVHIEALYRNKWEKENVRIFAVMVNEESIKDWPAFINEHAGGWTHVHQTAAMRSEEEKAGKPNFRQLYDMRSTPTLYLLDKDKRIIAKNIGVTDLDNVLQEKINRENITEQQKVPRYEIAENYTANSNVKIDNTRVIITPIKNGGVYEIPVEINGIPMSFIFDTGASNVCISLLELKFLIKQNRFSVDDDIIDSARFTDANGDVSVGAVVNIKSIKIGNRVVKNVKATVVLNLKAPLLLGQSFIQRFGKVTMDNFNNVIIFE